MINRPKSWALNLLESAIYDDHYGFAISLDKGKLAFQSYLAMSYKGACHRRHKQGRLMNFQISKEMKLNSPVLYNCNVLKD
jgi:hypothetical protein